MNQLIEYNLREEQEKGTKFREVYQLQTHLVDEPGVDPLGNKNRRICRYCLRGADSTRFKDDAHVIPQAIGGQHILDLWECDDCNHRFSKYETALAAYAGALRSLTGTRGANGIPTYKNPADGTVIRSADNKIVVRAGSDESAYMTEDRSGIRLELPRESYVPLRAFKSIARIGYAMIREDEWGDFEETRKWLLQDGQREGRSISCILFWISVSTKTKFRREASLYTKKNRFAPDSYPYKVLVLRYGIMQYQLAIPYFADEVLLGASSTHLTMLPFPLLFETQPDGPVDIDSYVTGRDDLTSMDKKKGEIQRLSYDSDQPAARVDQPADLVVHNVDESNPE